METYNAVCKLYEEFLLKYSIFVKTSTGQGSHWPWFCISIPEAPLHKKMMGHPINESFSSLAMWQEFLQQLLYTSCCTLGFQSVGWRSYSFHQPSTLPPFHMLLHCCLIAPVVASPELRKSIPAPRKVPYVSCPTTLAVWLPTEAVRPVFEESALKWPSCWIKAVLHDTNHIMHIYIFIYSYICSCVYIFSKAYCSSLRREHKALRHGSIRKSSWQMLPASWRARHSHNRKQK